MRTPAVAASLLLALATSSGAARADRFALPTLTPAPAGDRFFVVQSADTAGHGTFAASVTSDIAVRPLVLTPSAGGDDIAYVGMMVQHHLATSLGLGGRVKLGFSLPIASVGGEDVPQFDDAPSGTAAGDLGTSLRVVVLGGRERPYRLSIGGRAWWPTGDEDLYLSDGSVRGGPDLMVSGRAGRAVWAVNLGLQFRPQTPFQNVIIDDQFVWGAGVAGLFLKGRLQVGLEIVGSHVIAGDAFGPGGNNVELLLGPRYRFGPIVVGPAAGPGLSDGLGTPSFRVLFGLAFAPQPRRVEPPPPPDDDRWRPPPPPPPPPVLDSDGDGILDPEDACPRVPGVESQSASERGCPIPDRDQDGIPDTTDACPYAPGPPLPDPRRTGCPSDRDFDSVLDPDDACPDVKGSLSPDPSKNGCPRPGEPPPQ